MIKLYLLTRRVVNEIKNALKSTTRKKILKLSKPGFVTNKTPSAPKQSDNVRNMLILSFNRNIEKISEKIGAAIVNVVNSGRETYFRAQKLKKGIGT